jgi:hypothetical protein
MISTDKTAFETSSSRGQKRRENDVMLKPRLILLWTSNLWAVGQNSLKTRATV